MNYYNKFKKIISYINFIFGIYLWALVIYAILRATGLIKRFALQEPAGAHRNLCEYRNAGAASG